MPYALRVFSCSGCGVPVMRRLAEGSVARCTLCAIEYQAEWNRQLNAHCGPLYDTWVRKILASARPATPSSGLDAPSVAA